MKKILKIIAILFIFLLLITTLFLFSRKINITNIKQIITSKLNSESSTASNVTVVDVTNLDSNIAIEHEHIFKSQYDDTNHWEECIICNNKQNIVTHTFKTSWASGKESCIRTNSYVKNCICGFSESGHKPCVWNGKSYADSPNSSRMLYPYKKM